MREACSPYSPNQSPQHSRSRYHNRPGPRHPLLRSMEDGNRLPHLNRRTDRCGCSHRSSRYSRNTGSPHNMPHHNPHIRHRCRAHSPTFHRPYREGSHRCRHSTPRDASTIPHHRTRRKHTASTRMTRATGNCSATTPMRNTSTSRKNTG